MTVFSRQKRTLRFRPPNSNHVPRISLVLTASHLRQGREILVSYPPMSPLSSSYLSLPISETPFRTLTNLWLTRSCQPRLHPQGRPDPEIRAQYLPPVLSGEISRYRLRQGQPPLLDLLFSLLALSSTRNHKGLLVKWTNSILVAASINPSFANQVCIRGIVREGGIFADSKTI